MNVSVFLVLHTKLSDVNMPVLCSHGFRPVVEETPEMLSQQTSVSPSTLSSTPEREGGETNVCSSQFLAFSLT